MPDAINEPPPKIAIQRKNHAGSRKNPSNVITVTVKPSQTKNRPSHKPPTTYANIGTVAKNAPMRLPHSSFIGTDAGCNMFIQITA